MTAAHLRRASDMPVPAPASWPRLLRELRPTDEPVLPNDLWFALRSIERGTWRVAVFSDRATLKVISSQVYVVDDFGSLVAVPEGWDAPNEDYWQSTLAVDVAATDWWHARCAAAGHAAEDARLRQRTRDLLCPPPVTVEVVTEPLHPLCAASLVVGPDPRTDAPLYSLHIDREDPVLLTHVQLCALVLGAQQLVKAAMPRGRVQ